VVKEGKKRRFHGQCCVVCVGVVGPTDGGAPSVAKNHSSLGSWGAPPVVAHGGTGMRQLTYAGVLGGWAIFNTVFWHVVSEPIPKPTHTQVLSELRMEALEACGGRGFLLSDKRMEQACYFVHMPTPSWMEAEDESFRGRSGAAPDVRPEAAGQAPASEAPKALRSGDPPASPPDAGAGGDAGNACYP